MKSILIKLKGHPHVQKGTAYTILFAMGFCHLLNDMIQSVIPAMYPVLKDNFGFTFAQIGIITLVFQLTSSIFQPFVGQYADRRPQPYSLSAGMCFTLTGLLLLAFASNVWCVCLFPVSATSKVSKANSMGEEIIPSEFRNKLFSLKLISIVLPKLWE